MRATKTRGVPLRQHWISKGNFPRPRRASSLLKRPFWSSAAPSYPLILLVALVLLIPGQLMFGVSRASASQLPSVVIDNVPNYILLGTASKIEFHVQSDAGQAGQSVLFLVYPKITSRSGFDQIRAHGSIGYPLIIAPSTPLGQLAASGSSYQLPIQIDSSQGTGTTPVLPSCATGCQGVYPLAIRVINTTTGNVVSQTTVPIIILETPNAHPLNVVPVVEIAPTTAPSVLSQFVSFLASTPQMSLTVAPYGQAVASLTSSRRYQGAIGQLTGWAKQPNHQIIATTFSPVTPECALSGSVPGSFQDQLTSTRQLLSRNAIAQSGLTYYFSGRPTKKGIELISRLGFAAAILPPSSYPPGLPLTLVTPLIDRRAKLSELVADPGIASDLSLSADASVASEVAVADLGQVYFDAPNSASPRSVTTLLTIDNSSSLAIAEAFLSRVESTPLLSSKSAQQALTAFSASTDKESEVSAQTRNSSCPSTTPVANASRLIRAFSSVQPPKAILSRLNEQLLVAEGNELPTSDSSNLISSIRSTITSQLNAINVVQGGALTLTSKTANIPISLVSQLKYPLSLVVHIHSDKLTLPRGSSKLTRIQQSSVTVSFSASTKALGTFPMSVTLSTPSGLLLKTTELEIRSTSFSLVGIVLTGGSLLVLIVWWIRSPSKRRKAELAAAGDVSPATETGGGGQDE